MKKATLVALCMVLPYGYSVIHYGNLRVICIGINNNLR